MSVHGVIEPDLSAISVVDEKNTKSLFDDAFTKASRDEAVMHIFLKNGIKGKFSQPAHAHLIDHFMHRALGSDPHPLISSIDAFHQEVVSQNGQSIDSRLLQDTIGEALKKLELTQL